MNKKLTLHRGLFRALLFGMAVLLSIVPVSKSDAEPATITVFAAASTTNVITDICQLYDNGGTEKAVPSFASSSTLAKQIGNGAPADVYISANEKWMDYLEEKGCIDSATRFV
jgi:molybdate transport system substrate-binding protein